MASTHPFKRAAIAAVLSGTAITGAVTAEATPVYAADGLVTIQTTCDEEKWVSVWGARAYWHAQCQNGRIYVTGWVEDTAADGECGQVEAFIDGFWHRSRRACPKGEIETFSMNGIGYKAGVFLTNKPV